MRLHTLLISFLLPVRAPAESTLEYALHALTAEVREMTFFCDELEDKYAMLKNAYDELERQLSQAEITLAVERRRGKSGTVTGTGTRGTGTGTVAQDTEKKSNYNCVMFSFG